MKDQIRHSRVQRLRFNTLQEIGFVEVRGVFARVEIPALNVPIEIIDDQQVFPAARIQGVRQVTTNEPGASGNDNHAELSARPFVNTSSIADVDRPS